MGKIGAILIFLFFVFFPLFLVESQISIAPIKIPNDCEEKSFCTCNFSDSKFYCLLNEDLIQKESYYDSHLSLIEITTSSLVLDCQGHKIEGKNKEISGIKILWLEKIKVKNCILSKFLAAINISSSKEIEISQNQFFENRTALGGWSQETKILDNYFSKNFISISLDGGKNQIENNKIEDGDFGIDLIHTIKYYTLKNNILNNNRCNFQYSPLNQDALTNEIDKSNLINGKSIYFLKNVSNQIFDETQDMATFYCLDCQNIVLKNLKLSNNGYGIYLFKAKDSKIENVDTSYNCYTGIGIFYSSNITVSNSTSSFNGYSYSGAAGYGIYLEGGYENKVFNSVFEFNKAYGITLSNYFSFPKHLIANNRIGNNEIGIFIGSRGNRIEKNYITSNNTAGIWILSSNSNIISENEISNNLGGIGLLDSTPNTIFRNNFYDNIGYALSFAWSHGSEVYENNFKGEGPLIDFHFSQNQKVFHNNFFYKKGNFPFHYTPIYGKYLHLDDGYPSGGNYWSDYQGEDKKSGENQDEEGSDRIGDTPYCIEIGSTRVCDRYPFLRPYGWLHLPNVLISEVYYDVAKNKGKEGDNEWVIIHNLEEKEINLSGWQICDNESCDTLPEIILPPKSYAIISPTSSTFNYWKIPKDMAKIVLKSKIGNGLSNDGDRLILKDKDGNIIDALSYGDDNSIFDPPARDVKEGKSLLRYPPERDTDSAKDFIESNPTIENQSPIPIINFFPKNPIKGIEVKFNASSSTDPDGEIANFEWQIKNASTLEILATSTATTTSYNFPENGDYEIILTATDNDGATSSTSTILKVEPFSFAIITDLHIGRGYDDYDSSGFDDSGDGEDYYLTERLKNVVQWIIDNRNNIDCGDTKCPIKFLAVLGDIADSAEKSEFLKAKKILDKLNDPNGDGDTSDGIPYVPVFGNHDVWPWTESTFSNTPLGEQFFEEIFWDENATNTKLMKQLLNWERDKIHREIKNFLFNYGGINFIGLDFNSREKEKLGGAKADGILHEETINWLKEKLDQLGGKEKVVIFSHHPFTEEGARKVLKTLPLIPFPGTNFNKKEIEILKNILMNYENLEKGQQIFAHFGGHVHGYEEFAGELGNLPHLILPGVPFSADYEYPKIGEMSVLTTEALMVGSNFKEPRGIIRIVKIKNGEEIEYNKFEINVEGAEHKEFGGLNPRFEFEYSGERLGCVFFKADVFTEKKIVSFDWSLGDGEKGKGSSEFHCYSQPGVYTIELTVKDENGNQETITKKIKIPETAIWPKIVKIPQILKEKLDFISVVFNKDVTQFGRTKKDTIFIKTKPKSPSIPIGLITIHFEKATEDIDLSDLIAETNLDTKKTILYSSKFFNDDIIEKSKVLFVPK